MSITLQMVTDLIGSDDLTAKVCFLVFYFSPLFFIFPLNWYFGCLYGWIGIIMPIKPLKQVWDYQTKSCVQTLEGHTHNVSAVCFHPELPIIITGSEDGTVRIWHSTTYR